MAPYSTLPHGCTRIIRLKPSKDKISRIECQLIDYNLSETDQGHIYEAVSYVWGGPNKTKPIFIETL